MTRPLTSKQQRFVDEYLIDLTAKHAAIRAGYSVRTAEVQGYQLLQIPLVAAAVDQALAKRSRRTGITADRVLDEMGQLAFTNITDLVEVNENSIRVKPSSEWPEGAGRAVAEISEKHTKDGTTITVKMHDKGQALVKVGQHVGLFRDKVEVTGKDGGAIQQQTTIHLADLTDDELAVIARLAAGKQPETGA